MLRVLIADIDLYRNIGGGQTFYRAIIEKNPGIEFTYLVVEEAPDTRRPANARCIPYEPLFDERQSIDAFDDRVPPWCLPAFLLATNLAYSMRNLRFDVVDLPDYKQFGYFLPAALDYYCAAPGSIALSLHGVMSRTHSMEWTSDGSMVPDVVRREETQYLAADLRYGLSTTYLEEWRARFPLRVDYFCPLRFLNPPTPIRCGIDGRPPDLHFVGRTEKRKGPDVFAELCWWLPPELYGQARIIGPPSIELTGTSSDVYLQDFLRHRPGAKPIELCTAATAEELRRHFSARTVTVLPSRYDTFNLVAIESLFLGCPTAIGDGAGVCRFLNDYFPAVPYVRIEMARPLSSVPRLAGLLTDYDDYRRGMVDALTAVALTPRSPPLKEIYGGRPSPQHDVRGDAAAIYRRLMEAAARHLKLAANSAERFSDRRTRLPRAPRTDSLLPAAQPPDPEAALEVRLSHGSRRSDLPFRQLAMRAERIAALYEAVAWMPEWTEPELQEKWRQYGLLLVDVRVDRARLYRDLARVESLRGNDLVADTYRLRAMRLCGHDRHGDLAAVVPALIEQGFPNEAAAAAAIYDLQPGADRRCEELLRNAADEHRQLPLPAFECVDDRREPRPYRASVIVSLYKAAKNLPRFLEALSLQTLLRAQQAEVVLIDSGSPEEEYRVFRRWADQARLAAVYARSEQRETIQAAWNRGIALARGRYLSFLGVDETLLPRALEILAEELDTDPKVDWVQANSLVTSVDERGDWLRDIMIYDRTGYAQHLVYLETCYLSYVGAMYRRSVHDRCGYYDASFRAAGDTEFKNRVLPSIKSKAIEQTLGIFWNYPAGQTTRSPVAEVEDLRAWYLHRTPAGVRYALSNVNSSGLESLLFAALKYRKSYNQHTSSDIEYAWSVVRYLAQERPDLSLGRFQRSISMLLEGYRRLDDLPRVSRRSIAIALRRVARLEVQIAAIHRLLSGGRLTPNYNVFCDNRHEQHHNLWIAPPR